ncbi:MAG TPA: flavodoxin domain-containing protein [Candidatus Limnocylindria bacterium]|nr:flavodoxin domain-containing protein [Candidatus Limnocylindria bacterium]
MKVLVTVASKHGSTAEIGEAIAATLTKEGHTVDVLAPTAVPEISPYDAVILGSGVYAGHWIGTAKDFAAQHAAELRERPVWLFSSGPLGDQSLEEANPIDLPKLTELLAPRGHAVFAGALAKDEVGFAERAIISLVHAPYGDFRDWEAITTWARGIADALWHVRLADRGLVPA